jgi:hypothetical protein
MTISPATVLREAMQLRANDRAALVDELLLSLDKPDPELDALWLKEAESRLAAYKAGTLGAVDAKQVFAELGKKV